MSNVRRYDELRMVFDSDHMSLFPCKSRCKIFYKFEQDGNNPESKFRERSIIENALIGNNPESKFRERSIKENALTPHGI